MSRSNRHKEKYGSRAEHSRDNCNEGTAARTRPLSFDDIMTRRKKKKQSGDADSMPEETRNVRVTEYVEKFSGRSESGRGYRNNNDSSYVDVKHSSEDILKGSSRKKDDKTSVNEGKSTKRKDKESRDSETKSKATLTKDDGDKTKRGKDDRQGHGRRNVDEWSSGVSENESEKRRGRVLVGKERYPDESREKSEKENKRKHRYEDDERSRVKSAVKRHDSGKRYDSEISVRKDRKEPSEFHNEESKTKRRRSRSREREKDRSRKSRSLSPKSHKRTSYHVREHVELSSHSSKDRSKKQLSDDDRNRISGNGSSSHYWKHGGSASKLGGYSPRKRKTEAAVKTPSPAHRSPEKKSAGWDFQPIEAETNATSSVFPSVQSSKQIVSSTTYEMSSIASVSSSTVRALSGVFSNSGIDSVQLTQATRPMRRLYVENLPASASEKSIMECLNNFLLSSGVNYIHGTQPCISCIIHREKGQALVEFLTPEDASAALSFDGKSFVGSILKIRRPKDYVEVATGEPEKSEPALDTVSGVVSDSPHKIFIGGVPRTLSSEMLKEIASAFGHLKAFHLEFNMDLSEPCAFLEYSDHSVTPKACAGLNGMRLGGQMLTVVLASPDAPSVEQIGNSPFYGVPEHAKPLLQKPTPVLKLNNVLDPVDLSSLTEAELDEILEDIRLECTRFGTVKSVNVVKSGDCHTILQTCKVSDETDSARNGVDLNYDEENETELSRERIDLEPPSIAKGEAVNKAVDGEGIGSGKAEAGLGKEDKMCESFVSDDGMALKNPACENNKNVGSPQNDDQLNMKDHTECGEGDNVNDAILTRDAEVENKLMVQEKLESEDTIGRVQEAVAETNDDLRMDSDALVETENTEPIFDHEGVFELGSILVEYTRAEASSAAAHCLHGRHFDNRIVTAGYVAYHIYKAKFPK